MGEGAVPASAPTGKVYSLAQCREHMSEKDCWLVIHGKVYNVTDYLDEHPGGFDIVVSNSGKDATEDYDEIGHSRTAQEMLQKYLIGDFEGGEVKRATAAKAPVAVGSRDQSSMVSAVMKALLPLLILILAISTAVFMGKR